MSSKEDIENLKVRLEAHINGCPKDICKGDHDKITEHGILLTNMNASMEKTNAALAETAKNLTDNQAITLQVAKQVSDNAQREEKRSAWRSNLIQGILITVLSGVLLSTMGYLFTVSINNIMKKADESSKVQQELIEELRKLKDEKNTGR